MRNKKKGMKKKGLTYGQKVILFACEAIEELVQAGFIHGAHYSMKERARFELESLKAEGFQPDEQDILNCASFMRDELGFTVVGEEIQPTH
jgi:hypothetical protein